VKLTGATSRQIRSWVENGIIHSEQRNVGNIQHNRFTYDEICVMTVMVRLIAVGFIKPTVAVELARKHYKDVAVLTEMGYAQVSSSTEHTIGDGLVLTITG